MMLHPTQELEPPANPVRFNAPVQALIQQTCSSGPTRILEPQIILQGLGCQPRLVPPVAQAVRGVASGHGPPAITARINTRSAGVASISPAMAGVTGIVAVRLRLFVLIRMRWPCGVLSIWLRCRRVGRP